MMVLAAILLLAHTASSTKILALHGGGQTGASFEAGIQDLVAALPGYDFVFPDGAYAGSGGGRLWISDPPSKSEPTTDPDWAVDSVQALDEIVRTQGPFYGILGYSQGSAMVPVYLAQMNSSLPSFEVAMMFCGYLTNTHTGILATVTAASPFDDIPALVWMGEEDGVITNELSRAQAAEFTSPEVICSAPGTHDVPGNSDSTFSQVVEFVESGGSVTNSSGTCTGGSSGSGTTAPVTAALTVACTMIATMLTQ